LVGVLAAWVCTRRCAPPAAGAVGVVIVWVTSLCVLSPHPARPHRNKAVTNQHLELRIRVFYGARTL